jgi:protein tyrosine phosphatase (PTP) superfamily phosphohydrolase (DUF442 family)
MSRYLAGLILLVLSFEVLAAETGNLQAILNFHQYSENVGSAGQPTEAQFAAIKNANFSTVVNLALHDSNNALQDEGSIVSSLGMTYIHIPVPWDAPSASHVRKFLGLMQALEGEKVFVHCAANYRASVFTHRYLTLKQGLSSGQATSPLLQQWLPEMDSNWQAIMQLGIDDIEP